MLVFAERTVAWPVGGIADITIDSLRPIFEAEDRPEILFIGCGPTFDLPPKGLKKALKEQHGIVLEWMDTGAACRTFNVLLLEERSVAAALIAV